MAATNAAAAGVVVVTSAGNSGPGRTSPVQPGTGSGALSVAAMDTIEGTPHVDFIAPAGTIDMQNSNGSTDLPVTGTVVVLEDDPATADVDESLGCAASDYAAVQPGDIAVTYRGVCARVDRAILGQAAGAAAVVMINNADSLPPFEGTIAGRDHPVPRRQAADEAAIVAAAGTVRRPSRTRARSPTPTSPGSPTSARVVRATVTAPRSRMSSPPG